MRVASGSTDVTAPPVPLLTGTFSVEGARGDGSSG